ncbi:disease resistance protein RPS5-like [Pistacia vera]|uniref:disease resistance protein RPS5-like n=1 Tax=Pistacia vera TaxID=55513 RepID=UPI00126345DE|nr:disease resistance protein RPS5-like [Pistacia vera]
MFNKRESGKFDKVSHLATLPGIEFSAPKDFHLFKSVELVFHQIIEALKNDKTHVVGLYGMGGVGKTTLAKAVGKKVKEEEIFDEVVVIVVSQAPNFKNIQGDVADSLGMKLEEEGEEGRAKLLHLRFVETKKKILIILDDVWKKFDLKSKIGIPFGDDLKDEDEGLTLLKKHASILDDESHPLNDLAVKVAKECKGLPLAIVTMGSALKEKGIDEWTLVFEKLKKSKLVDICKDIDVDEDVYAILKISFDYLEGKETKLCFLLCSLFPEDYKIPLEELVRYGMRLGVFPDVDSIEQARSQLQVMVNKLKASCLLTDASEEGFVKMHDVVRDVALGIASRGDNVFLVKASLGLTEWPKQGREISNVIKRFSQLEELYVGDSFDKWEEEETSVEGSNASLSELNSLSNLVVLFLKINAKCLSRDLVFIFNKLVRYDISVNTDSEFSVLESRKGALTVKDIEAVSLISLKSLYHTLEYLCLKEVTGCDSILPIIDKGGLNKLISLVLEDCKDVKCIMDTTKMHVPAPTFSNLVKLSLRKLNLLREICCGPYEKLQSGSLENLEAIHVEECPGICSLFPAMLLQRLYKLKEVTIQSCNKLEEIFQLDGLCHRREENLAMLSSLAKLDLANLPQLRCIWKWPTHIVNFKSLTIVQVRECKSLIYLFTLSVAQSLVQLKSLKVIGCESLKHLLMKEGDE